MTVQAARDGELLPDQISSINADMERLAAEGEWAQVSTLLERRNAMLREIDDVSRETALREASRSTERIHRLAVEAHNEIGGKLAQLKRGKKATDSYRAFA